MSLTRSLAAALGLALAALAVQSAAASPTDAIKGRWAFNWASDPSKTRCREVEGALLTTLRSKAFVCDLSARTNSSTGAAYVSCKRARPEAEYLIFKTRALCEAERTTQVSNGD